MTRLIIWINRKLADAMHSVPTDYGSGGFMPDSYEDAERLVKETCTDVLHYLGHSHFEIYCTSMKFIITLEDGSKNFWMYSARQITRSHIVGEIVMWLMDRVIDE